MRVSSTMMVDNYLNQTNRVYESQTKLMEQSDGSKLHRPSDDAIGYSKYLRYTFNQVENDQYISSVKTGISWMKSTNAAIMDMEDCIKTVIDKTVQGGNDTNGEVDLKAIAAEMEAMVQQTVSDANMQIGNRYVLAGQNDKTQPFVTSENTIQRGVAKTLDEQQQRFFAKYAVTNSNGTSQMLTLRGNDGGTYYLDTTGGYVFTEDFVQSGYKDVIAGGRGYVLPSDAFAQLKSGDFNGISNHFSSTGEIIAQLGQSTAVKPVTPIGGATNEMPTVDYYIEDYTISCENGLTVDTDGTIGGSVVIVPTPPKATAYSQKNGTITFNNGVEIAPSGNISFPGGLGGTGTTVYPEGELDIVKGPDLPDASTEYEIKLKNGLTLDSQLQYDGGSFIDPPPTKATSCTKDGDDYKFDNGVTVHADGSISYTEGTGKTIVYGGGGVSTVKAKNQDFTITYADGVSLKSDGTQLSGTPITLDPMPQKADGYERKADGSIVFYREDAGQRIYNDCLQVRSNGKLYVGSKLVYDGSTGSVEDSKPEISDTGVDVKGVNLTFATVEQKIVTYNGDYNYISMVKENGSIKPESDTVNVTAADVFGTDIFDNEASGNDISGTAGLNQLYTIVAKADQGEGHWLSSDGITVANAVYDKALVAQTKVAARLSVYNEVSTMLEEHGLTITDDISAVADTDVAQLSVLLNTITTIYSMSLAVGSRVLPMSLADYL